MIILKVAIVGSRSVNNFCIENMLEKIPEPCTTIISGGAAGIDSIAEKAAEILSVKFIKILPDYSAYGEKAPLLRNRQIIEKADMVLAFWDFKSRGTAFTISECLKTSVPVKVFKI